MHKKQQIIWNFHCWIYLSSLPEAITAILRIEIEERATLRMCMVHRRLILWVISIIDSSAIRWFLFDIGVCKNQCTVYCNILANAER